MTDSPEPGFDDSYSTEPGEATYRFPWPPADDAPVVGAFIDTWRDAVLRPTRFFRAMPTTTSLGAPLLYYLVIGILAAAIQLFWATLLPQEESALFGEMLGTGATPPLLDFLMSPILLLLSLLVAAGVTHLLVLMLVPGNGGFGATLRIFCFAYSPAIFAAVPYLGPVAAFLWMTVLSIVGIREVHRTTTARAVTSVLIPLLAGGALLAVSYLLLRSGSLLLSP